MTLPFIRPTKLKTFLKSSKTNSISVYRIYTIIELYSTDYRVEKLCLEEGVFSASVDCSEL